MGDDNKFQGALREKRVPIVVLDQKWHRLFALSGKPEHIAKLEEELNLSLRKQGQFNHDIKELKAIKKKLMENIVVNMEGTNGEGSIEAKNLEDNRRLIDEVNEKIEIAEDELLDMPPLIKQQNELLMLESMSYSYAQLRQNLQEADEISEWITQVRKDLKKNIIKKQNREINSRQIYSYMHDIFGAQIIDLFDLHYEDVEERLEKKKET